MGIAKRVREVRTVSEKGPVSHGWQGVYHPAASPVRNGVGPFIPIYAVQGVSEFAFDFLNLGGPNSLKPGIGRKKQRFTLHHSRERHRISSSYVRFGALS